jgi:hypothetical protein
LWPIRLEGKSKVAATGHGRNAEKRQQHKFYDILRSDFLTNAPFSIVALLPGAMPVSSDNGLHQHGEKAIRYRKG